MEAYPELKQGRAMTLAQDAKPASRKASELKRQSKKFKRHDYVRSILTTAMATTQSLDEFIAHLAGQGAIYYTRGKHHGVEVRHLCGRVEKYRFTTLGMAEEFEAYQNGLNHLRQADRA